MPSELEFPGGKTVADGVRSFPGELLRNFVNFVISDEIVSVFEQIFHQLRILFRRRSGDIPRGKFRPAPGDGDVQRIGINSNCNFPVGKRTDSAQQIFKEVHLLSRRKLCRVKLEA